MVVRTVQRFLGTLLPWSSWSRYSSRAEEGSVGTLQYAAKRRLMDGVPWSLWFMVVDGRAAQSRL